VSAARDALRASSFFDAIGPRDLEALATGTRWLSYEAGELIFSEGEPATRFYVLVEGSVQLCVSSESLQSIRHAGDPIGWSALLEPYAYRATATAREPTRLLALDRDMLDRRARVRPVFGAALMRALIGLGGDRLRAARVRLVARRYDDEVRAIGSLVRQSGALLHAASPLHRLPHHLENRLTLDDAFHLIDVLEADGDDVERRLATLCADVLEDVRRELWLYQRLQAIYDTVAGAPASMQPEEVRARSMHEFRELFSGTSYRILGREHLPGRPGHIFVMNHLMNHPDNVLPNGFILTLDTHFVASLILFERYGEAPIRVIRKERPDEYGHQLFYDRLGYVYVYSGHVDPKAAEPAVAAEARRRVFLDAAAAHLRRGTNIVICPEGTSTSTEEWPVRFRRGAFQLAAEVDPEPLIVPIAVANFDKKLTRTPTRAVVHEPFRLSEHVADPADDAALTAFVNHEQHPRFRRWVREAAEIDSPIKTLCAFPAESRD
jgi:CRP-like cAMP-binding protein/1-acyl-sn-glycerol-3-phosphate acyltransferase